MRRKERAITDEKEIDRIIGNCDCCRLGFADGGEVYIVPLSFGYVHENGRRVFFFHGAKEGRKLGLVRKNGRAGFELDANRRLVTAEAACSHSMLYESVIGSGVVSIVEESGQKTAALRQIMKHCTGREDWDFTPQMLDAIAVIELAVDQISCKAHY